jgi:phospholipid/cholesterol/gamma-HCH transport system substrate-binding protein
MTASLSPFRIANVAAAIALVVVVVVLVLVVTGSGPSYTLHADFANASGLVDGGLVEVAGRDVGSITDVGLTPDGQAEVTMSIGDQSITPLHVGTRASIRALGQAGITNHFVDLSPGAANAATLPSGSTLSTQQTFSMVNYDELLDAFGPAQRTQLDQLIANSADVFAGSGSKYFNGMLSQLDPALAAVDGVSGQLAADRVAIEQVITTGDRAASAIALRDPDLQSAVQSTATALSSVASQRTQLADLLARAPGVLDQGRKTLADAGTALTALRPALKDVIPTAAPLRGFLERLTEILPEATPVVTQLNAELPSLDRSLTGLAGLKSVGTRALRSAATALQVAEPIIRAARFYGSDFVLGILGGLVGAGSYNYSRWGHYERLDFIQPPQTALAGIGANLLTSNPLVPGIIAIKTHLFRRCPGGNVPPAVDGSSPWIPDTSLCTPSEDIPASVNVP